MSTEGTNNNQTDDTGVQVNTDLGQQSNSNNQTDITDYKAKYLAEIENSKKSRARAQAAESQLVNITTEQEAARQSKLKEDGEYKELVSEYETKIISLTGKIDGMQGIVDDYKAVEAQEKEALVTQLPREEREKASNLDLETLRYVVDKTVGEISQQDSQSTRHTPGKVRQRGKVEKKNWLEMDSAEQRENWEDVVKSYSKK